LYGSEKCKVPKNDEKRLFKILIFGLEQKGLEERFIALNQDVSIGWKDQPG
jgi:hypothetical protein